MPLNLKSEFYFFYHPIYVKKQLLYLFIWAFLGLFLVYISPYYFLSYFVSLFGFSLFIYFIGACKKPFLSMKNHTLLYGTLYKSTLDLKRVSRIKHYGDLYIFKTDNKIIPYMPKPSEMRKERFCTTFSLNTLMHMVLFFPED